MRIRLQPEFRKRLSQLIDQLGSQSELSRRSGVPQSMISLYEKGINEPSAATAAAIAKAAGVSLDWLIGGIEGPPLNEEILAESIDMVLSRDLRLTRRARAEIIVHIYAILADASKSDAQKIAQIQKLVA